MIADTVTRDMSWGQKLHLEEEIAKTAGAEVTYARIKLLCEVFDDERFAEWCDENGKDRLQFMNDRIRGSMIGDFRFWRKMYQERPSIEHWVGRNLASVIAEYEIAETKRRQRARFVAPKPVTRGKQASSRRYEPVTQVVNDADCGAAEPDRETSETPTLSAAPAIEPIVAGPAQSHVYVAAPMPPIRKDIQTDWTSYATLSLKRFNDIVGDRARTVDWDDAALRIEWSRACELVAAKLGKPA